MRNGEARRRVRRPGRLPAVSEQLGTGRLDPPVSTAAEGTSEGIQETQPPTPEGATPNARRAVGLSLRTSLTLQVMAMITGIELARGLGLDDRGALAAAMLWPIVLGNIATLGVEESLTYNIARDPGSAGRLLGSALALCGLQALAFTALTAAVVPLALADKGSEVIVPALIYTLYVPLNMFGVALMGTLNGLHRYEWFNRIRLSVGIFLIVMQTVLLVTGPFTVEALVIGMVSCYLATALVAGWLVRTARPGKLVVDRATIRTVLGFGVRSHSSYASSMLNQRLGQLVVSIFLTNSQLGLYVVAVTFTSLTGLVGGAFAYATLPNVASLPEGPQRTELASRLVSMTLLFSFALSLPIFVLAPQLITAFFGSEFAEAADVTRVLLLGTVALSTNRAIEAVLRAAGRPLAAGMAELVALCATIVLTAALLPVLELTGAALASAVAYVIASIWMTHRATRLLGIPARRLLIPDRSALVGLSERVRNLRAHLHSRAR